MNLLPVIIILLILCPSYSKAQDVKAREVLPAKKGDATVPPEVMNDIYFGAFWKPKAFETFACSYDLAHWTKWEGPHLIEPSEPWDSKYAHKPWVVVHDDVVYHFYNAVGSEGRVIALATSEDLRADDKGKP